MACEDSTPFDRCLDGRSRDATRLRVHRVCDVHDLEQAFGREMSAFADASKDFLEALQRVTLDDEPSMAEGDDLLHEAREVPDDVLQRAIPCSDPRVPSDRSAREAVLERTKYWLADGVLRDLEQVDDLPTESCVGARHDPDMEHAFAVDQTGQIVIAHDSSLDVAFPADRPHPSRCHCPHEAGQ